MKKIIKRGMTVLMAVIFSSSSMNVMAAWSSENAKSDYRNMEIRNTKNVRVEKPTAQFAVNRISNGEIVDKAISYAGYDCSVPFTELVCYVGDKITFEDLSHDNNPGGKLVEWDWQRFGSLGDHYKVYNYNVLETESIDCTVPGETIFYLSVRNNQKVKNGCCDPWSENGNHQIKGTNKWFPKGAYWYFTAVKVIVKPMREAKIHVRYWDTPANKIIKENTINVGQLKEPDQILQHIVTIEDIEGYTISNWNVYLLDKTIQYSGTDRVLDIGLSNYLPEKFLNIECYPKTETGVEVRYWDSARNKVISSSTITGPKLSGDEKATLSASLAAPRGYSIEGWNIQLPDGTIESYGTELNPKIEVSGNTPSKYLNVECYVSDSSFIGTDTSVDVKYYSLKTEVLIAETTISGSQVFPDIPTTVDVELVKPNGYYIDRWDIILDDDSVEKQGVDNKVNIMLDINNPHKTIKVFCNTDGSDSGGDDDIIIPDPTVTVFPDGACVGVIEWTETESHKIPNGYYPSGRQKYKICTHTFTYRAILNANATISPDTFKSGYGFELLLNCGITQNLISNIGDCNNWGENRRAVSVVRAPDRATVYLPWTMTNSLGTQGNIVSMEKNGNINFILPQSRVSQIGARKIYTPVELAGSETTPVSHSFDIYINGGGVGNIEFCKKLVGTITINGVMYDDDFSGAD
ncbi:MAG: hypothetical protein KIG65_01170 [Eubacteriales bacterium]|nr:hypothetical protein [Eubacteriales bacterium]